MKDFIELLKKFPKKRIAVGILLFDNNGKVLILKPGYKDAWTLPGGVVNKNESPVDAALREVKEEIGIKVEILRCLAIDYSTKKINTYKDESLQILFLGNKLSDKDIAKITIDNEEIIESKFVETRKANSFLNKHLSSRLGSLNGNYENFVFLENGKKIL